MLYNVNNIPPTWEIIVSTESLDTSPRQHERPWVVKLLKFLHRVLLLTALVGAYVLCKMVLGDRDQAAAACALVVGLVVIAGLRLSYAGYPPIPELIVQFLLDMYMLVALVLVGLAAMMAVFHQDNAVSVGLAMAAAAVGSTMFLLKYKFRRRLIRLIGS